VIHVANGADVDVGFLALKFGLRHFDNSSSGESIVQFLC